MAFIDQGWLSATPWSCWMEKVAVTPWGSRRFHVRSVGPTLADFAVCQPLLAIQSLTLAKTFFCER